MSRDKPQYSRSVFGVTDVFPSSLGLNEEVQNNVNRKSLACSMENFGYTTTVSQKEVCLVSELVIL